MLNGILTKFRKKEIKEPLNSILRIKTKNANDLYFVIPNICCVSDIQEENFSENKNYIIDIYTQQNKIQIFSDSKTKAKNRQKKIISLIRQWWNEHG